ncbi:hypothetical protein T439DRAFT_331553 [Meredithblackwellia eburnea MCA 4105]
MTLETRARSEELLYPYVYHALWQGKPLYLRPQPPHIVPDEVTAGFDRLSKSENLPGLDENYGVVIQKQPKSLGDELTLQDEGNEVRGGSTTHYTYFVSQKISGTISEGAEAATATWELTCSMDKGWSNPKNIEISFKVLAGPPEDNSSPFGKVTLVQQSAQRVSPVEPFNGSSGKHEEEEGSKEVEIVFSRTKGKLALAKQYQLGGTVRISGMLVFVLRVLFGSICLG